MIGMANTGDIVTSAVDEDVDLVGLNVGGHIDVAIRAIESVRQGPPRTADICRRPLPPESQNNLEFYRGLPARISINGYVDAAERLTGTK